MSTRSQKRKMNLQENTKNVSEVLVSPIWVENIILGETAAWIMGPSRAESPRVKNSTFEILIASLKEEITSKIKGLLLESQRET